MRPSRFLSLRLLPRLLIPYACVTVLLVARLNRFICSQGLGSCECVARDCGFSIQEVRPCWDFQLSASCGVACTRMFWPRLLYRMLSLETALLSSCAGLLPVSSVRHRCASEPLTTCSPTNGLWRAMRYWLGFVSFQFTLCYVLGRLFGCSVLTESILAYRGTMSTKIVRMNKIFGNSTLVLCSMKQTKHLHNYLHETFRRSPDQIGRAHV